MEILNEREEVWTTVLTPEHKLLDLKLREVIRYRDLIWLFVNRDFVTQYKQTILGPLWYLIQPLFSTFMYIFVFGSLAKISTDGIPYLLFYYGGTMLWTFFEKCFRDASETFSLNADIFGKVYFPRMTVPISRVFINLLTLCIQLALLVCFYLYYFFTGAPIVPSWGILAFPLIIIWLAIVGMGMGLLVSAITTKYRDLKQLVAFGMNLWMYATPVVYPISQVPESLKWVLFLNPVSAPIELFRIYFYGVGTLSPAMIATSLAMTGIFFFLGLVTFTRNERTFIDVV